MGRVYVCPVVGSGGLVPHPELGEAPDPRRALIAGLPGVTRCRSVLDETLGWTVCRVEASDWTAVETDGRCVHLDAAALDGPVPPQVRNALDREGIVTRQEVDAAGTVRAVLRLLVDRHWPGRDETVLGIDP